MTAFSTYVGFIRNADHTRDCLMRQKHEGCVCGLEELQAGLDSDVRYSYVDTEDSILRLTSPEELADEMGHRHIVPNLYGLAIEVVFDFSEDELKSLEARRNAASDRVQMQRVLEQTHVALRTAQFDLDRRRHELNATGVATRELQIEQMRQKIADLERALKEPT